MDFFDVCGFVFFAQTSPIGSDWASPYAFSGFATVGACAFTAFVAGWLLSNAAKLTRPMSNAVEQLAAANELERRLRGEIEKLKLQLLERPKDSATVAVVRAEQELVGAAFASLRSGVIISDAAGRVTFLNSAAEQLTGWDNASARGAPVTQVFSIGKEDALGPDEHPVVHALREGEVAALANHTILFTKDGEQRVVEHSAAPIRRQDAPPRGAVLMFRDTTQQTQAAEEIQRLNRQLSDRVAELQTLLDVLPIAVWQGDASCERIVGNRTAYEMFELDVGTNVSATAAEFVQELVPYRCVVNGKELAPAEMPMQVVARTGRPVVKVEYDIVFADGRVKTVWGSAAPLKDAAGQVRGVFGAYVDITDRKQVESALRASEERSRLVRKWCGVGFWYCDEPSQRLYWDETVKAQFFFRADADVTIDEFYDRVHSDDRNAVFDAVQKARQSGVLFDEQYRVVDPASGAVRWIRAIGRTVHAADGSPVRFDGVTLDVTAQKAAEVALREADRRKDEFIAILAHELRNPLAPIRTAVEILKVQPAADESLVFSRSIIERQTATLARLLDDLLDVSRISRNRLELRKSYTPISIPIETAIETSRAEIDAAGHELVVSLPSEPLYLDADPVRLTQVFANLLNNAAKFTPSPGRITLTVARREGAAMVTVTVADTGVGFAPEALARMFEMFSQPTPPLQRVAGGLGIGLALSKRLVELHGGVIEAESAGSGLGSEFRVRLPLAKLQASVVDTSRDMPLFRPRGYKILVADDNRDAADALAKMLTLMGNDVRTAVDGLDAIAIASKLLPDVIVLDLGMPRLNGYEAAWRIREQPWGRDVLLIALTGWGQAEDRLKSEAAGFDHHLVKPASPELVADLIVRSPRRRENQN